MVFLKILWNTVMIFFFENALKLKKSSISGTLTSRFQGSTQGQSGKKTGLINMSNPKHLLGLKTLHGDDPEQNAGTIRESNQEYLLVFNARPIHESNP